MGKACGHGHGPRSGPLANKSFLAMGKLFGPWDFFRGSWPEKLPMTKKMCPMGKMVKYLLMFLFNRNVHDLDGQ